MSTPGPKPKSATIHQLHGNPSKKPVSQLLDEFRPDVELPKCPRFMHLKGVAMEEAKREYVRIGQELVRYGLVSELDRGALAVLACEWGLYVWAQQRIAEVNAEDPAGEKGLISATPQGYRMQSVYLQIARKAQENYLKGAALFGLTPSDRTRVTPGLTQMQLPGMEKINGDRPLTLGSFA